MKKLRIRHGVLLIIHHLASGHIYVPKKKSKNNNIFTKFLTQIMSFRLIETQTKMNRPKF